MSSVNGEVGGGVCDQEDSCGMYSLHYKCDVNDMRLSIYD